MDQYKCQRCNQEFQNQDELNRHNRDQHQGSQPSYGGEQQR
jgi:DNA-directed RNA polymerase subunit RPC12/RpoP